MSDVRRDALSRWAELFENMTPESIGDIRALCAPNVHFRDPFNDLHGVDMMVRVFEDMYETCDEPRFTVQDRALGEKAGYLRWSFEFKPRRLPGPPWRVEGMSEVHIDERGLILAHLDHWDASSQFYARLPVLRGLIGLVRRRLAISP